MKVKSLLSKWLIKSYWPHWVGGILLAGLNITLTLIYKPWSITGDMADWGLRLWAFLGGHPEKLDEYFREVGYETLYKHPFYNEQTILNIGLILGVLLAVALAAEFHFKPIKSGRQLIIGIIGGVLMGYGARLALGCNVGAMLGGIASQSLHGWIFGLFLFFGSLTGTILVKYFTIKIK